MVMVMNGLLPRPLYNVNLPSHSEIQLQTPRELFVLYRTENKFFKTFSNFKHGYIKKFYWSSHMFHWSSHFFISRGPRTDKFRGVCSYFKIWTWKSMVKVMCVVKGQGHVWPSKFKGQGYGQGQPHWWHFGPGVESICLLFLFSCQSYHFWLRYRKFHIWPWKFKVKVMAKVKPDGHIWALEFNWYVWFSFRGNQTIFGWDMANSIFDLENLRSRSWPRSNPMVTFEP